MRLIDADALDKALEDGPELYFSDVIIVAGAIDGAPTVECAACEACDISGPNAGMCRWDGERHGGDWFCGDFQRRQP